MILFCFWSSPRKGLCVWIDYKVVCDFLFMVNYRLFRPFLSASRTREAAAIFCSFCGIRSASASRYGQACFQAASGAAYQAYAGRIASRHYVRLKRAKENIAFEQAETQRMEA